MTEQSMLTSIDLFAGAGGLSEGLREAGFECLYANEVVAEYSATYNANHPITVDQRDIRAVDAGEVRLSLGLSRGELDLLAGGPPCQGFSINAPKRSAEDPRNHLFRRYLSFAEAFMPKLVLIENVPGLISFGGGSTLSAIMEALSTLGYSPSVRVLYAPHYGVPQTRFRTFIMASRQDLDRPVLFPQPTRTAPMRVNFTSKFDGRDITPLPHSIELPRHTTVREALDDLPGLTNGSGTDLAVDYATEANNDYQRISRLGTTGVRNHRAPQLSAINMERLRHIPPGGNWTDIPHDLLPAGMKLARRSDHTKRYGRADADGLSSTILTKCDPHWGAYFHYSQLRAFTVREAARLQSFPDSYVFLGSRAQQYEQVGNAVPPLMAAAVGHALAGILGQERDLVRSLATA